jgi:hypothetical protein
MKCSLSTTSLIVSLLSWSAVGSAFVAPRTTAFRKSPTKIFLEDWVADMIDGEKNRLDHMKDFEKEWMEKNREAVLFHFNDGARAVPDDDDPQQDFQQMAKDRNLAKKNPQQYCADRCIATGNCDVYEDFFHFTPEEVVKFCNDCVLGGEEDNCDIPDAFYEPDNKLKP